MDRYTTRRDMEDLVVPNYSETSDSYPSPDMWNMMNSATEKGFDYDVINNGFSGGLYSEQQVKEETKRSKSNNGCFYNSLHDFDGIQQMDDIFLNSILEDVPGNMNLHSYKESDYSSPGSSTAYLGEVPGSSTAYLNGGEVPMYRYDWETCQNMSLMEEDVPMNLLEEEASAEEVVLQDLQRASEKLTDDTRKCFRDTFYRLAKNSQSGNNTNSEQYLEDRTREQESELETNSLDRAVANLTFNMMESNMRNLPPPKRISSIQG